MEAECHKLDLELAQNNRVLRPQDSQSFSHYCELIGELNELTRKRNNITMTLTNLIVSIGCFTILSVSSQAHDSIKEEILSTRQQLEDTVCINTMLCVHNLTETHVFIGEGNKRSQREKQKRV